MPTAVAVSESRSRDSRAAGVEAASGALVELRGARPGVWLVFATAGHDQQALLDGVVSVAGNAPVTGCSAEGVITRSGSDESAFMVAVMAIASDELTFHTYRVEGLSRGPAEAAKDLCSQIAATASEGKLLLVFPDGVSASCGELLTTLDRLMPFPVPVAGGTAGDLLEFRRTYQYHAGQVSSDSVSALLIGGEVEVSLAVTHGCDLIGLEKTITRAERGMVYEIDGQPAWSFFKEYLDEGTTSLEGGTVANLSLAERVPGANRDGYGDYLIRVPVRLEPESGALLFAAGPEEGTKVQLALRNPDKIAEHTVAQGRRVAAERAPRRPLLVLQFDCAGRGRVLFGDSLNELLVSPLQREFPASVPWLGLHTYGEIAPLGGATYFHNYTLVLCALYARQS